MSFDDRQTLRVGKARDLVDVGFVSAGLPGKVIVWQAAALHWRRPQIVGGVRNRRSARPAPQDNRDGKGLGRICWAQELRARSRLTFATFESVVVLLDCRHYPIVGRVSQQRAPVAFDV